MNRVALFSIAFAFLVLPACNRTFVRPASAAAEAEIPHAAAVRTPAPLAEPGTNAKTIYATWYNVPLDSLAARRAAPGELTAAHNKLRIGARLRVTHLENGKSAVVRITDRGVPRGKAPLDLCRRAAEELGMIGEGRAKVRIELLPDDHVAGGVADSATTAAHP